MGTPRFDVCLVLSTAGLATPYGLSYGGRLTESSGKPVSGPVDLRVTFFRSVSGNDQVAVVLADFTAVTLQDGIFQIPISLSAADFHTLFNGVDSAFIQVEDLTHSVTYPRQKFSAVPYALKVPVDGTSITYNANGRLSLGNGSTTLALPATAGSPNQVLKTNGSGVLSWANDETAAAGSVTSAAIADDAVVDADINTNAAIAGTKINPNFGAQNVVTTGSVNAASFSGDGSALTNLPAGPLGTSVDSAEIENDTIVNADINTNAAIAGTKISPNFGSQSVVTTGSVTGAEVKATDYLQTGTVAGVPAAGDCDAAAEYGRLRVDTTNNRLYVCSTSGWVLAANNAGALLSTQNLSDVGDASLARTNLGLGALATKGSIADGDVAAGAAIAGSKINPNFGAQNITTTGTISGNGSGLTNLPPGAGLILCPAGFTMIGDAGKRGTFCIDTNQRSGAAWHTAKATCAGLSLTEGAATMCDHSEWLQACNSGLATGMTGDAEWVADFASTTSATMVGATDCLTTNSTAFSNARPFRCCVR